jgi:acetolactate synthase-1/2/3 large subunit
VCALLSVWPQVLLLNNQHLGMVVQWEDRFYKVGWLHTYTRSSKLLLFL